MKTNKDIAQTGIAKTIYEYWEGAFKKPEFENKLLEFTKEELVEFIMEAQRRGVFKRIIHQ